MNTESTEVTRKRQGPCPGNVYSPVRERQSVLTHVRRINFRKGRGHESIQGKRHQLAGTGRNEAYAGSKGKNKLVVTERKETRFRGEGGRAGQRMQRARGQPGGARRGPGSEETRAASHLESTQ